MSNKRDTLVPDAPEEALLDDAAPSAPSEPPAAETHPAAAEPEPELPPDPFARARAALDAARAARGDDDTPDEAPQTYTSLRTDPLGRAEAALEAARAARGVGVSTSRKLEDARAEAELRRLKKQDD